MPLVRATVYVVRRNYTGSRVHTMGNIK